MLQKLNYFILVIKTVRDLSDPRFTRSNFQYFRKKSRNDRIPLVISSSGKT